RGHRTHRDRRNRVDLVERGNSMQMRGDRDEPIECRRHELRITMSTARLTGMEALVLSHVGQVRCDETDSSRAELARGSGEEVKRQGLYVGIGQRAQDDDVAAA